jgi:hypothetical protein
VTATSALLLLCAVALVFTVSGRLLVGALRLRWLLPLEPARAAGSAILGTASCVVVFDRLSAAGLSAPRALAVLALGHAGLLAAVIARGELRVLRPRGRPAGWIALVVAVAVASVLALLPVFATNGYAIVNDTYAYCAFSEWLQGHGFGIPGAYDPTSPVSSIPVQWQQWGFPLGAAYALALVQASTGSPSLVLYPVVSAWGLLLGLGGVWLAARWALRLPTAWAAGASIAFALLPHPGYWAHHNGFLSQTYAVPVLLLAIATTARVERARCRIASAVGLLSVLAASLLAVYLPFLPLIGAAAGAAALAGLRRVPRGRGRVRCVALHASTAAIFLALAGLDLGPLLRGLPTLAVVQVGYSVPMSFSSFLSFAVGTGPFIPGLPVGPERWAVQIVATGIVVVLAALGLAQACRRRGASLLAVAAVLGALVGNYALVAHDPWTGHTGHTWNVFKAVQWAFPVVLLLQAAGAALLARWRGGRALLAAAFAVLLALSGVHWSWSETLGRRMRSVVMTEQPLQALPSMRSRLASLPAGTLLVLGRPARTSAWLAPYIALLAYPRRIVGDWSGSASIPLPEAVTKRAFAESLARIGAPDVVVLRAGVPPPIDARGAEDLEGGLARLLDLSRPRLVQLAPIREVLYERGRALLRVGPPRSQLDLVFFSARPVSTDLQIAGPSAGASASLAVQLIPGTPRGRARRAALERARTSPLRAGSPAGARAELSFGAGLSTVVLSARSGSTAEIKDVFAAAHP